MFDQKQRRTGLPTMRANARRQCKLIVQYSPVILAVYNDPALQAALAAVALACEALIEEADRVIPSGN